MFCGTFEVKPMPGQSMTEEEMEAQLAAVSEAAEALDYFTEDELEESCRRAEGA